MTATQQLSWSNLEYYLTLMVEDKNSSKAHFLPTIKRLKERNLPAAAINDITLLMRNAYGLGAEKSF